MTHYASLSSWKKRVCICAICVLLFAAFGVVLYVTMATIGWTRKHGQAPPVADQEKVKWLDVCSLSCQQRKRYVAGDERIREIVNRMKDTDSVQDLPKRPLTAPTYFVYVAAADDVSAYGIFCREDGVMVFDYSHNKSWQVRDGVYFQNLYKSVVLAYK